MSDFVTRLAERAMGTTPVVQPLIASMFVPEPASRWMESTVEGEPAPPPGDPARMQHGQIEETHPAPDTPTLVPDDVTTPDEDRDTSVTSLSSAPDGSSPDLHPLTRPESSRHSPTSGQEDRDVAPNTLSPRQRPRDAGESGSLKTRMESSQVDQQNLSSAVPRPVAPEFGFRPLRSGELDPPEREAMYERSPHNPPRVPVADGRVSSPEPRFETEHRVEPAPARRGVDQTPRLLVPEGSSFDPFAAEDGPGRAVLRTTTALAERVRVTDEAPAPPSDANGSPKASEVTPGSDTVLVQQATQGAVPAIVPRIVRHQPDQRREQAPRESRVLAPEPPAPTIRVAIGRIEVRAITPPAPAQRETPVRPGPLLSLDDYLKQRNGGRL